MRKFLVRIKTMSVIAGIQRHKIQRHHLRKVRVEITRSIVREKKEWGILDGKSRVAHLVFRKNTVENWFDIGYDAYRSSRR